MLAMRRGAKIISSVIRVLLADLPKLVLQEFLIAKLAIVSLFFNTCQSNDFQLWNVGKLSW